MPKQNAKNDVFIENPVDAGKSIDKGKGILVEDSPPVKNGEPSKLVTLNPPTVAEAPEFNYPKDGAPVSKFLPQDATHVVELISSNDRIIYAAPKDIDQAFNQGEFRNEDCQVDDSILQESPIHKDPTSSENINSKERVGESISDYSVSSKGKSQHSPLISVQSVAVVQDSPTKTNGRSPLIGSSSRIFRQRSRIQVDDQQDHGVINQDLNVLSWADKVDEDQLVDVLRICSLIRRRVFKKF